MTGSAKQSISPRQERMDCFVAEFIIGPAEGGTRWLLAMTSNMTPHSRGAIGPSFANCFAALNNRGRRECRVPNTPVASRAKLSEAHERSHHRYTGVNPAFPAQWFYGLLRALPGDQALLSPSPALLLADLTPTLGRQNHTTSPYASASFVRLAIRAPDAAASTASRSQRS